MSYSFPVEWKIISRDTSCGPKCCKTVCLKAVSLGTSFISVLDRMSVFSQRFALGGRQFGFLCTILKYLILTCFGEVRQSTFPI